MVLRIFLQVLITAVLMNCLQVSSEGDTHVQPATDAIPMKLPLPPTDEIAKSVKASGSGKLTEGSVVQEEEEELDDKLVKEFVKERLRAAFRKRAFTFLQHRQQPILNEEGRTLTKDLIPVLNNFVSSIFPTNAQHGYGEYPNPGYDENPHSGYDSLCGDCPVGNMGLTGYRGTLGYKGDQGIKGMVGIQGDPGVNGVKGVAYAYGCPAGTYRSQVLTICIRQTSSSTYSAAQAYCQSLSDVPNPGLLDLSDITDLTMLNTFLSDLMPPLPIGTYGIGAMIVSGNLIWDSGASVSLASDLWGGTAPTLPATGCLALQVGSPNKYVIIPCNTNRIRLCENDYQLLPI